MVIGDVIQTQKAKGFSDDDDRDIGIILKLDTYRQHHYEPMERIAEILWNNGRVGWISLERVALLHTNKYSNPT
tara:strand:+ start:261 stop:482 length:222 start_codon:yes stop_codon:yes gene_type:complete